MRFSTSLFTLAVPLLSSALPVKRQANPTDLLVLKFADVLEQLESTFYAQALTKFQQTDFVSAGFVDAQVPIQQFQTIQRDEAAHSTILQQTLKALGDSPITSCQFNFDAALKDVPTMAATARVVENLGVTAYLGAAHLVSDPVLLTAAGSILTVEARHQTVLNILNGGGAIPQAFDFAFSPSQVLAMASPFISGCDLGVPANPTLTVTNTGTVAPGTALTFSSTALNSTTDGLFCQMLIGGAASAIALPLSHCVVPEGINGPVALFITSDSQPLANNVRDQATNTIVAGPTIAIIDTVPENLGSTVRKSSGSSGSSSSSTASSSTSTTSASASTSTVTVLTTISPQEASSILASLSQTSTASASATSSASATASPAASASSASNSSAASSPSPTASPSNNSASGSTSVVLAPGGPNMYTGPSADGTLNILGWSTVQGSSLSN